MEIEDNERDEKGWESQSMYVENKCMNLDPANCQLKGLEPVKPTVYISAIMVIVVDQILRGLKAFRCE
jgi:hypothetical protein